MRKEGIGSDTLFYVVSCFHFNQPELTGVSPKTTPTAMMSYHPVIVGKASILAGGSAVTCVT
jgi:hypothetical protein